VVLPPSSAEILVAKDAGNAVIPRVFASAEFFDRTRFFSPQVDEVRMVGQRG
jgi:hypothetical protein